MEIPGLVLSKTATVLSEIPGRSRHRLGLCLALYSLTAFGCGGADSSSTPSAPSATTSDIRELGSFTVPAGGLSAPPISFDVSGASSVVFVAIPNSGQPAVDITSLTSPSGQTLVTRAIDDVDPIGRNPFQQSGSAVTAGMLPHSTTYEIEHGRYEFQLGNPHETAVTSRVVAVVNPKTAPTGGSLDVNLIFCGIEDISGSAALNNPSFLVVFKEFSRILAQANVQIGKTFGADCPSDRDGGFADLDINSDIGPLFSSWKPPVGNEGLNIFFVNSFLNDGLGDIFGFSGGRPGPPRLQSTNSSGVAIAVLQSKFADLSSSDLLRRGRTMAHEVGHYMGLFHSTESSGAAFDPIPDTPQCGAVVDFPLRGNFNHSVDPEECGVAGGARNLMFWTQGPDSLGARDQISPNQAFVLVRNPLVR